MDPHPSRTGHKSVHIQVLGIAYYLNKFIWSVPRGTKNLSEISDEKSSRVFEELKVFCCFLLFFIVFYGFW